MTSNLHLKSNLPPQIPHHAQHQHNHLTHHHKIHKIKKQFQKQGGIQTIKNSKTQIYAINNSKKHIRKRFMTIQAEKLLRSKREIKTINATIEKQCAEIKK
jgi:hypothetical protein